MQILNGKSKSVFQYIHNSPVFIPSEKAQPPLTILPTYFKLATCILAPEYVSIYVKYCYLDALVLLIQIFLEHTPGRIAIHRPF